MILQGEVLWGANNIFSVDCPDQGIIQCRIKGKILDREGQREGREYNPLAPGDQVVLEWEEQESGGSAGEGVIISRKPRVNAFIRYNKKRLVPQTIAANLDLLCVVASAVEPPFRPRFIDRVLVAAGDDIPVFILLNKEDQLASLKDQELLEMIETRLESYESMNYPVERVSALQEDGTTLIRDLCRGKRVLFFGQSGVGKSTLLNTLYPELDLKVGAISKKYNRGRHTTTLARAYRLEDTLLIDTPGVREIVPWNIEPGELAFSFRDFLPHTGNCRYQPCLHREEPDCAVQAAVFRGDIHQDRYESYLRILGEMV